MIHSRRDLLKASLGTSAMFSLSASMPMFMRSIACAAAKHTSTDDTVLVVVQLTGGNDGLNTLVPFDHDAYARSRHTLRLTRRDVLAINDHFGFHPDMPGFERLYKDGHLTVVQSAGCPNNPRNHDPARLNWQTAEPSVKDPQTGWIGRAIDLTATQAPNRPAGAFVGNIAQPFAMNAAESVVPTIRSDGPILQYQSTPGLNAALSVPRDINSNPMLDFTSRCAIDAAAAQRRLASSANRPAGNYPAYQLADDLRTVAQLIRADLGIRLFYVELGGGGIGGFDNHANQKDNHAALLSQLAGAVTAFIDDLKRDRLLDRVLLMTFSEFGRTVSENGRRGTGHGEAAPMFLAGGRLAGGLIGPPMNLDDLVDDAPRAAIDFRRVYATALSQWLRLDSRAILGADFTPLAMFT
ncbi:DUF1501 domain-containing protein [Planctomycetales bacterium ZRK34]|nr:DUF1501 domain-containing protein [Planctomycetales bacterium ZRK34]